MNHLPQHVAVIIDGNRRWAKINGLSKQGGHKKGYNNIRLLMEWLNELGIRYCTIYALSTENMKREPSEVAYLMKLFLRVFTQHLKEFHQRNIRLLVSGRINDLSKELQVAIAKAVRLTKNNTKAVLNLAINYGGRSELLDAVKKLIADNIPPDRIDEEVLSVHLYQSGELPDPDLIIRTGGHKRLSNFLPWQSVYSELYFTDTLWPDLSKKDLEVALRDFVQRKRNFGR